LATAISPREVLVMTIDSERRAHAGAGVLQPVLSAGQHG
jgi:hypothetical protein